MRQQRSHLEYQVRFADRLARRYLFALTRLRDSGRIQVGRDVVYQQEALRDDIAEAAGVVDGLVAATAKAKRMANAVGIERVSSQPEPFRAPLLDNDNHRRIRLDAAMAAISEIRGLQASLPDVDWSRPSHDLEVDLLPSAKRAVLLVGGVIAALSLVVSV